MSIVPTTFLACGGSDSTSSASDAGGSDATTGADAKAEAGKPGADAGHDGSALDGHVAETEGGADADAAAPWTPAAIRSELAFWFDPTSLVAADGGVPQWSDLSGNGNDAVQTNGTYQPAYNPTGIGGLPSATFNGPITFLTIADTATMQWGTGDFAVFAVIRATSATIANYAMIYQKTGAGPQYDGFDFYINSAKPKASNLAAAQVSGTVYVDNTAPPSTFIDSTVHLLGGRRTGGTLEIRVDGMSSNTLSFDAGDAASPVDVDISAIGANAQIGQNGGGIPPTAENQQLHGDIAEIIGVKGTLADADVANIESYLKARYAIQ